MKTILPIELTLFICFSFEFLSLYPKNLILTTSSVLGFFSTFWLGSLTPLKLIIVCITVLGQDFPVLKGEI